MANVMMFGFLFLVAVVAEVRAQSSTITSTVVTPSATASNTASSTVTPSLSTADLPQHISQSSKSAVTFASVKASSTSTHGPASPTINATYSTIKPTTSKPSPSSSSPSTKPTTYSTIKPATSKPSPSSSSPSTKPKCSVPSRHTSDTDFKPSDDKISHNGVNYNITEKSCSNKDDCCAGDGKTTMTLTLDGCDNTTVGGIACTDITEPCKCGAGLLSATFLISLLGMLLYFVF